MTVAGVPKGVNPTDWARVRLALGPELGDRFLRRMEAHFKRAGLAIVRRAKQTAPRDKGLLSRSIACVVKRAGPRLVGLVGTNRPEGFWTEYGNAPGGGGMIRPKRAKALMFKPRRFYIGKGGKGKMGRGKVFTPFVRPIKVGSVMFPRKRWRALATRGGSGQTMPWLRPSFRKARKEVVKIIRDGAARTLRGITRGK